MSADLNDLIARLAATIAGSDELSAEIARDVMGHVPHDWPLWFRGPSFDGRDDAIVPAVPYTTSVDAALTLVPAGYRLVYLYHSRCPLSAAEIERVPIDGCDYEWWYGNAVTAPLAICIAALRARQAMNAAPYEAAAPDDGGWRPTKRPIDPECWSVLARTL